MHNALYSSVAHTEAGIVKSVLRGWWFRSLCCMAYQAASPGAIKSP